MGHRFQIRGLFLSLDYEPGQNKATNRSLALAAELRGGLGVARIQVVP